MRMLFEKVDKENPTWCRGCLEPCALNKKTTQQEIQFNNVWDNSAFLLRTKNITQEQVKKSYKIAFRITLVR